MKTMAIPLPTACLFPSLKRLCRTKTLTVYNRGLIFDNGQGTARIAQTLRNLKGKYVLSFRHGPVSARGLGAGFSCSITPKIGNRELPPTYLSELTSNWESETQQWSAGNENVAETELSLSAECAGEYDMLVINIDDVTLTEVCDRSGAQN
jgi:hypothetical protein